jgi:hypothetical protein
MKIKSLMLTALVATGIGCVAPAAATSTVTFNSNLGGGPFGTVTWTGSAGGVVTVAVALNAGVGFVNTGINNFAFSVVNGIPLTAANFTGFSAGWSFLGAPTNTDGAPGNPAGFTQYALACSTATPAGCGTGANSPNPGPLNFIVTASGLTEASFANLWIADICTAFTAGSGCSGATGATWTTSSTSGGGGGSGAPEPSSSALALLGLALLAGTFLKRKMSQPV